MNGIKMSDCRFYVNKDARVVVCVIPHTRDMLKHFIEEHFRWKDFDFGFAVNYEFSDKVLAMPWAFSGKAVCAPEDEWDEELGKMLAFARAKDKCYQSFFRRANKFVQAVDARLGDMITLFNDFGLKLENKRNALQEQIDGRVTPRAEE